MLICASDGTSLLEPILVLLKSYLALGLTILFNALAHVLLKLGVDSTSNIKATVSNPLTISSAFCFGLSLLGYSIALSRMNLSLAYPIVTTASFALVIATSIVFLHERPHPTQILGIILVLIGVCLISTMGYE